MTIFAPSILHKSHVCFNGTLSSLRHLPRKGTLYSSHNHGGCSFEEKHCARIHHPQWSRMDQWYARYPPGNVSISHPNGKRKISIFKSVLGRDMSVPRKVCRFPASWVLVGYRFKLRCWGHFSVWEQVSNQTWEDVTSQDVRLECWGHHSTQTNI